MGKPLKDMIGYRVHRLTVIARGETQGKSTGAYWICQCDCGNKTNIAGQHLRTGAIKSCGCHNSKVAKERMKLLSTKHGMCKTRIYKIWTGMCKRCLSTKDKYFHRYGARGITVCDEWSNNFMSFVEWSDKNGYAENLSIDRIENNGNYEPSNCRWTTKRVQANNRAREGNLKNTRYITYQGVTYVLSEFADKYLTVDMDTFWSRLQRGIPIDQAMSLPIRPGVSLKSRLTEA